MWNGFSVCGGIMELKILVLDWSEMWKSLEGNSDMVFSVSLVFWYYMDTSLLMRF